MLRAYVDNGVFQADNTFVYGNGGHDAIDLSRLNLTAGSSSPGATVRGGDGNDSIIGTGSWDYLYGQNGNDSLFGNEGNDTLSVSTRGVTTHTIC